VRTTTDGKIQITTPSETNRVWEFDTTGALTIPGDIKSENAINIDINLTDSTLRRWRFGEDGELTLPAGGDIKNSNGNSVLGSLVNGTETFTLSATGNATFSGETGGVNRGIVWDYGAVAGGVNSRIRQDEDGLTVRAYTENSGSYAAPVRILTNQGNNERVWQFDGAGDLTIPGDIKSENAINIDINLSDSTLRRWRFGEDGDLTFPDNTVQTTAYTGNTTATTPTTTGIPNGFTLSTGNNTNLTPGNYSNILVGFDGKNVTLGVQVSSEYNITIFGITNASPATFIISDSAVIPGNLIGGATPADDLTITVDSLETVAIDLTKTINKLTDGNYVLGDGVEGQIMYLVRSPETTSENVLVNVDNSDGASPLRPFRTYSGFTTIDNTGICTLIFTDGTWKQTGGLWD
jgi:hypothetical protein